MYEFHGHKCKDNIRLKYISIVYLPERKAQRFFSDKRVFDMGEEGDIMVRAVPQPQCNSAITATLTPADARADPTQCPEYAVGFQAQLKRKQDRTVLSNVNRLFFFFSSFKDYALIT